MSENQSRCEQAVEKYFFRASAKDFRKIPGGSIAYWLSSVMLNIFESHDSLSEHCEIREGINTGDNDRFLRRWQEVSFCKFSYPNQQASTLDSKWFSHRKGGEFRKWFGNRDYVVNWEGEGADIHEFHDLPLDYNGAPVRGKAYFFKPGLSWSRISSGSFALRYYEEGMTYDSTAPSIFADKDDSLSILGLLNSRVVFKLLEALSPTLDFRLTSLGRLPFISSSILRDKYGEILPAGRLIEISRGDWDSYEISWDFTSLPLLHPNNRQSALKASYQKLRVHWREMTLEMQRLEEENNRIFIDAYGLQDELAPDVPLNEITLTCNPHYRYVGDKSEEELEALLLADTMRELVSYAVGCMFGRYSLDKPGLILANQGETLADYLRQVPQPSFPADDDNVIPLLDGDWFPDDITQRFRQFLRVAFGDAHYEDNLAFIEQALNVKCKRNFSLRDYFLSEFYADHVKRYKKRPIYWLFSSPKGTFSALVYLHRYRPDTVSVVLSYLRDFRKKLASRLDYLQQVAINPSASQSEKTKASKEADTIKKQLIELDDYERDTLYPLATEQVELDLDDGVKVNYLKLGAALRKL